MGTWGFVFDVLGPVAVALLLMTLGWAALERGRIHRLLARPRWGAGKQPAAHLEGWRGERRLLNVFRFAHRTRRIHLALGTLAGWV